MLRGGRYAGLHHFRSALMRHLHPKWMMLSLQALAQAKVLQRSKLTGRCHELSQYSILIGLMSSGRSMRHSCSRGVIRRVIGNAKAMQASAQRGKDFPEWSNVQMALVTHSTFSGREVCVLVFMRCTFPPNISIQSSLLLRK